MTGDEVSKEINDINLAYLLLAQTLLKADRAAAMLRLGLSAELADMLLGMSQFQIFRLASSNFALCGFRLDNQPAIEAMSYKERDPSLQQAHIAILQAGRQYQVQQVGARS